MCFAKPLYQLVVYCLGSQLYSHIPLIPFISVYMAWPIRKELLADDSPPPRTWALLPLLTGLAMLAGYWIQANHGLRLRTEDYLALTTSAFLALFAAGACFFLGRRSLRLLAFPIIFLIFTVPFPVAVRDWIEAFFQHGSAEAAHLLFWLSGMPVFRQGMSFQLPGFSLQVAPECSGIHSSLVLFITSLVAGRIFLKSPWPCAILTLAVIPLALLRNGFRIVTIGHLCVHDPLWIDSPLHHRGGPLFFALSLIPFFLLLLLLRKLEKKRLLPKGYASSQSEPEAHRAVQNQAQGNRPGDTVAQLHQP